MIFFIVTKMLRFKVPEWVSIKLPIEILATIDSEIDLMEINRIENEGFLTFLEEYPEYINWRTLSKNPCAIKLLMKHNELINWSSLSENPAAIDILLENKNKIVWTAFSKNPHPKAVKYLLENKDRICWVNFSSNKNPDACIYLIKHQCYIHWITIAANPNAYEILKIQYPYFSDHYYGVFANMCANPNPDIIALLHIERIRWCVLSRNPAGIDILLKYPEQIVWSSFSENPHPLAIKHMRKNKSRIYWEGLLSNSGAMDLIKEMSKVIPMNHYIWFNPSLFEIDYIKMAEERMLLLREELMMKALHPSRIAKHLAQGLDIDDL